jgi:hypothetical protein
LKRAGSIGAAILLVACGDQVSPGLASIQLLPATPIHFPAIGDTATLLVAATDREGRAVAPASLAFISRDPMVATVDPEGRIESRSEGATAILVQAGTLSDSVLVTVSQARDSLVLALPGTGTVLSLPADASLPISCRAFDAAGRLLAAPTSVSSRTGAVSGGSCSTLQVSHSGHDTLDVSVGSYHASIPIAIAVRPRVLSDPTIPLDVDSLPHGLIPWAPSLVRNSAGQFTLFFAGYRDAAGHLGGRRGDLHRLVSPDGSHYAYDGVVLARDAFPCHPRGTGIENVAVVPQPDGTGWRMFFAAGSDECDGWQVFSATSDDEDRWTPEPGIRIPNGSDRRWPAGEGIAVDQNPSGEWRMLVGSYEQIVPPEDRFQITQWTSTDQLTWYYQGPVMTTRQVGPEAGRSVYSPTITDVAPGLTRMFFTGDNLDAKGGGSRIYSAVSVDGSEWEVEGVVLEGEAVDYFYSTVVEDILVFIRSVEGVHELGSVRLDTR